MKKRILMSLMLVALLAGTGYGVAAVLTIDAPPHLGHGEADVTASTISKTVWVLAGNPTILDKVKLTSDTAYKNGTVVHIKVKDVWTAFCLDGTPHIPETPPMPVGWTAGAEIEFDVQDAPVKDIDKLEVVINEAP